MGTNTLCRLHVSTYPSIQPFQPDGARDLFLQYFICCTSDITWYLSGYESLEATPSLRSSCRTPSMHPILCLVGEVIVTTLVTGFTHPGARLRLLGLIPVALCVLQCVPLCMKSMVRTPWAALVGGYSITYLFHYLDVAVLSDWSFEHNSPVSGLVRPSEDANTDDRAQSRKPNDTIVHRLLFGVKMASSFRFVGTPYQTRNTPPVIAADRKYFLQRTFAVIVVSYVVLDFINSNNDPMIASKYLTLEKVPFLTRLDQITAEEVVIRAFAVLAAAVGLNCVQGGIYNIFALLAVSTGVSNPSEWPPFYGSPRDAYTLRKFWK